MWWLISFSSLNTPGTDTEIPDITLLPLKSHWDQKRELIYLHQGDTLLFSETTGLVSLIVVLEVKQIQTIKDVDLVNAGVK